MIIYLGEAGQFPVIASVEECVDNCYAEPRDDVESTAQLLLPPWKGQDKEKCGKWFTGAPTRCLLSILVDGLRVVEYARTIRIGAGSHALVFRVFAKTPGFWGEYYIQTAGIKLSVEAGRVYALCFAPDLKEKVFRTWVVDNDTDQAVAGRKQRFDPERSTKYSNLCPA